MNENEREEPAQSGSLFFKCKHKTNLNVKRICSLLVQRVLSTSPNCWRYVMSIVTVLNGSDASRSFVHFIKSPSFFISADVSSILSQVIVGLWIIGNELVRHLVLFSTPTLRSALRIRGASPNNRYGKYAAIAVSLCLVPESSRKLINSNLGLNFSGPLNALTVRELYFPTSRLIILFRLLGKPSYWISLPLLDSAFLWEWSLSIPDLFGGPEKRFWCIEVSLATVDEL